MANPEIDNYDPPEQKDNKRGTYSRQLPLMQSILEHQNTCSHTLKTMQNLITCVECNAMWIK